MPYKELNTGKMYIFFTEIHCFHSAHINQQKFITPELAMETRHLFLLHAVELWNRLGA